MLTKLEVIRIAANGSAQKLKGGHRRKILLDMFTASAIVQVYDALNEKNQARYIDMPLAMMADVAWRLIAKQRGA